MALLTKNNCKVDSQSGGVVFTGSPELRAIQQIKSEIHQLNNKVDTLIKLLKEVCDDGREVVSVRFNEGTNSKI